MTRVIMLIPIDENVGLTYVTLGFINIIEKKNIPVKVLTPIVKPKFYLDDIDFFIGTKKSMNISKVEYLLESNQKNILIEEIISYFYKNKSNAKIVIINGLFIPNKCYFTYYLNYEIAKNLNAEVIFVTTPGKYSIRVLQQKIKIIKNIFFKNINMTGIIINKINHYIKNDKYFNFFKKKKLVSYIPSNNKLIDIKIIDICNYLNAKIFNQGDILNRRINKIVYFLKNTIKKIKNFLPNVLLIISSDLFDIFVKFYLHNINKIKVGGILLTNFNKFNVNMKKLYQNELPIFTTPQNSETIYLSLQGIHLKLLKKDHKKVSYIKKYITNYMNSDWYHYLEQSEHKKKLLTPYLFLYKLTKSACKANKNIILPEGNEIRTMQAASICTKRGIANCILLGNPNEIYSIAKEKQIKLYNIKIINPNIVSTKYIKRLIELRKDKGMTESIAKEHLKNNIVLGTMILENNEVDGLVSGAIHTTASTILPALQLIKTNSNCSLISSLFFMLLPDQVLVYADCAINISPTPEQLAEIAIQSADSAKLFGIDPIVAMISYATGNSATGIEVDKVKKATYIAKYKRPDLIIDGPLQYDAAIISEVAKLKAPKSTVAGRANVLVFPDLNTGNTVYKAAQRSANLISIGPMLQGIRKPVNDLSRGALVEDIVYTIALTAIQSLKI